MRRFWIDPSCHKNGEFILKGDLFHHVCHVSRIQKGEPFELLSGGQRKYKVELSAVSRFKATARVLEICPVPPLKTPYLHLALSLPRLHKVDSLLEKAVELEVKDFHPFVSRLSFFKNPEQVPLTRGDRWRKIISQASVVSERSRLMTVHPVKRLKDIRIPKEHLALMAYEGTDIGQPLKRILAVKGKFKEIWLFIGSEGGFSREEAEEFSKGGGEIVSFGDRILRVETACLAGLSILKYHYHQKG